MPFTSKGTSIKTFLILLIYISMYASKYPSFSTLELKSIEEKLGKNTKKRIVCYSDTIESYKKYSRSEQLVKVNYFLNEILPKVDRPNVDKENYWETPKEFLTMGRGDCEDYVIIKYFTLLKLGFEKDKLFMTVAYEKYTGQYHMVLSYFKNEDTQPLILDNLSFNVVDLKKRKDLVVNMFINDTGVYKMDKDSNLVKYARGAKQFKELIKRVQRES